MNQHAEPLSAADGGTEAAAGTSSAIARVTAFLRYVEAAAQESKRQLADAEALIARLKEEVSLARRIGEERGLELEELRDTYEGDLRAREQKAQELVEAFLRESFAKQLEDVRVQVVQSYATRVAELESALHAKDTAVEDARQAQATALAEVERVRATMATERAALLKEATETAERASQRHAVERDVFTAQLAETRSLLAAQYEERIRQLETTLEEKSTVIESAQRLGETLEKDVERVRAAAAAELREQREGQAAEKKKSEAQYAKLQASRNELAVQVKKLNKIISSQQDLTQLQRLEEERRKLLFDLKERDALIERLTSSLRIVRDACTRSPAARSIIAGASGELGFDGLFEVLK